VSLQNPDEHWITGNHTSIYCVIFWLFPDLEPTARMHQCLNQQEVLSLDDTTGDHETTREDKCAARQAYCFAVMRGRDLFSPLEDNDALIFPVLFRSFTATTSCLGFTVWNHKHSNVK